MESPYLNEEIFSPIGEEISHFQAQGSVLVTGDLNPRTGEKLDFTVLVLKVTVTSLELTLTFLSFPPGIIMIKTQTGVENKSYSFVECWICTSSVEGCEGTPLDSIRIVQTLAAALLMML